MKVDIEGQLLDWPEQWGDPAEWEVVAVRDRLISLRHPELGRRHLSTVKSSSNPRPDPRDLFKSRPPTT